MSPGIAPTKRRGEIRKPSVGKGAEKEEIDAQVEKKVLGRMGVKASGK